MSEIISIRDLSEALKPYNWSEVARATGIAYDTIRFIVRNPDTANPQYKTIKKLSDFVNGAE